jgi:hypothetical protein
LAKQVQHIPIEDNTDYKGDEHECYCEDEDFLDQYAGDAFTWNNNELDIFEPT